MRTAIFIGLIYIGDALGTPSYMLGKNNIIPFMAISLMIFIAMDIVDFLRNRNK
jgi:hypothetical protein